ncbi:hypothetical protein [Desulfofustis glycolicus]|nr:hypothetical protein [Desulfofustis glycolicus]MCB2215160.1 hypothetical protein [Desulfobulbaceae bacterium]
MMRPSGSQPLHLNLRDLARLFVCFLLPALFLNGCAGTSSLPPSKTTAFSPPVPTGVDTGHVPIFVVENSEQPYNLIGTPATQRNPDGSPFIVVDPVAATVYYERDSFTTDQGRYRNEIYRIHHERVPFGWGALNLTAGTNPGLLVIYTLNEADTVVLITTVHTCGCYLAFLPTPALPEDAYPADWPQDRQWIYGHTLPSRMELPEQGRQIAFTLADQTHRVSEVSLIDPDNLPPATERVQTDLAPLSALYRLPFGETIVSFFETDGPRSGYVKNNSKPLERLLIGWWALDFRVGEDKAYRGGDSSETIFYTSLKFWAREESDLKDFPRFLAYWGWNL